MLVLKELIRNPRLFLEGQKERTLSLRENFLWTFVSNTIYAACQWGILTLLAKLGTPDTVGRFTLGSAIAAPAIMFAELQMRVVQVTDVQDRHAFGDYFGVRLTNLFLALAFIAGLSFTRYEGEKAWVIFAFGVAKAVESVGDLFYSLFQKRERLDYVSKSRIAKGQLSLILFGAAFLLTNSIFWSVFSLAVASMIPLLIYDIPNSKVIVQNLALSSHPAASLQPRWNLKSFTQIISLAAPLGLVMVLISLNTNIPRYFLETYWDEWTLGIFSAMTYLPVVGNMIVSAMAQSIIPRLAKYYMEGKLFPFRNLVLKTIGIGIILGITNVVIAITVGQPLLTLLYTAEYASQKEVFIWIMLGGGIMYLSTLLGAAVSAMKKFKIQLVIHGLNIGVLLMVSQLLIPSRGLLGAAWASVGSALFIVLGYGLVVIKGSRSVKISS